MANIYSLKVHHPLRQSLMCVIIDRERRCLLSIDISAHNLADCHCLRTFTIQSRAYHSSFYRFLVTLPRARQSTVIGPPCADQAMHYQGMTHPLSGR
jgi:hypothetical protein